MNSTYLDLLSTRSDEALLSGSLETSRRTHRDTAGLVAHLTVIDERKLHLRTETLKKLNEAALTDAVGGVSNRGTCEMACKTNTCRYCYTYMYGPACGTNA